MKSSTNRQFTHLFTFSVVLLSATLSANTDVSSLKASTANQESKPQTFSQLLNKFDQDSSGTLSLAELTESKHKALTSGFATVDKNKDAVIDEKEFNLLMESANKHKKTLMSQF